MPDLIRILDIARRALSAHQNAMNTASNNIANANTEGFSRQRINLTAAKPIHMPNGIFGSGVSVESVKRIRDRFVDQQLMNERPSFNQFEFKSDALHFIEEIFNEPSDFGLNRMLEDFFNAFHDLANDPESTAARTVVRDNAVTLSNGFKRIHRQLFDFSQQLNDNLKTQVDEVNRYASQIAQLNDKIVSSEVDGNEASSLRDERDLLIDKLSKLVNVKTYENQFGAVNVAVGGRFLVVETKSFKLSLATQSVAAIGPQVIFENGGEIANITDGTIKGILDIRDVNVSDYLYQLDQLAVNFAEEVNKIHAQGFNLDGTSNINFFSPTVSGAEDFEVSPEILNDASLIATADVLNEPGNNNIALAIAGLQDSLIMDEGQATFSAFYNSLIASVGSHTQEATFLKNSFSLTVEKLELTRESISGVSLDEEMTNLIAAQQA
ncbi:MAG: flagellar hook-associated protein FlgK, partial [bacterium]